jgi:hypothetical protein
MNEPNHRDWTRQPGGALVWWCIPLGVAAAASLVLSSLQIVAVVWTVAFAWMGIGCLLNARRCHRLHCYFSGPVLLLGSLSVGCIGLGVLTFGPHGLNNAVSLTLVLALLSFVPEMIWGKYYPR